MASTMTNPFTQRLLQACQSSAKSYRPRFDVVETDSGYFVRDQERPIAYVHRLTYALDAFEFSPFRSLGRNPVVSPRYDMGTYINMHATLFQAVEGNFKWPSAGCEVRWHTDDPSQIRLDIHARYTNGEVTDNALLIGYDAATGQYLYRLRDRLRQPRLQQYEFCNVYPKDLGNGWPGRKKWQYTLWSGADGRLWKMPHNPALTCLIRAQPGQVMKRLGPQGFIGWALEEDFNLCVIIEQSSVPIVSHTCDMWYDEHLTFDKPGMELFTGNGEAEVEVTFRLIDAPALFLRDALAEAQPVPVFPEEIEAHGGPAFIPGQVNDLEAPMDPTVPQAGQVWRLKNPKPETLELEAAGRISRGVLPAEYHLAWVNDCGHSGTRSIRLRGLPGRIIRLSPFGHNVHVDPNSTYRFEGWIKTQGAVGRLWIGRCWYDWTAFYGHAESPSVPHDSDWTVAAVDIYTGDYPYLVCKLVVEGDGYSWFDDLRWYKLG